MVADRVGVAAGGKKIKKMISIQEKKSKKINKQKCQHGQCWDCTCSERDLMAMVADRVGVAAGGKKNGGGGAKRWMSGGESGVIVVVGRWEKVGRRGGYDYKVDTWSHVINLADWTKCKTQMVALVMWLIWSTLVMAGIWSDSDQFLIRNSQILIGNWSDSDQIPLRNWSDWFWADLIRIDHFWSDLLRKISAILYYFAGRVVSKILIWSDQNWWLTDKTSGWLYPVDIKTIWGSLAPFIDDKTT